MSNNSVPSPTEVSSITVYDGTSSACGRTNYPFESFFEKATDKEDAVAKMAKFRSEEGAISWIWFQKGGNNGCTTAIKQFFSDFERLPGMEHLCCFDEWYKKGNKLITITADVDPSYLFPYRTYKIMAENGGMITIMTSTFEKKFKSASPFGKFIF